MTCAIGDTVKHSDGRVFRKIADTPNGKDGNWERVNARVPAAPYQRVTGDAVGVVMRLVREHGLATGDWVASERWHSPRQFRGLNPGGSVTLSGYRGPGAIKRHHRQLSSPSALPLDLRICKAPVPPRKPRKCCPNCGWEQ